MSRRGELAGLAAGVAGLLLQAGAPPPAPAYTGTHALAGHVPRDIYYSRVVPSRCSSTRKSVLALARTQGWTTSRRLLAAGRRSPSTSSATVRRGSSACKHLPPSVALGAGDGGRTAPEGAGGCRTLVSLQARNAAEAPTVAAMVGKGQRAASLCKLSGTLPLRARRPQVLRHYRGRGRRGKGGSEGGCALRRKIQECHICDLPPGAGRDGGHARGLQRGRRGRRRHAAGH